MTAFLTTQNVQDLLQVDRSTVYRMAEDGRLPGVKVGRQWRFAADRIEQVLGAVPEVDAVEIADHEHARPAPTSLADIVSPDIAQVIADLAADVSGLMAVVTDLHGRPISSVANACGFYDAIAELPATEEMCLAEWRFFADQPNVIPRFSPSHFGFLCARSFVWLGHQPVGMVLVGGVTPPEWPPASDVVNRIAESIGADPHAIRDSIGLTYDLPGPAQRRVERSLAALGDLVSRLITEQHRLRGRLDAISALAEGATVPVPFAPRIRPLGFDDAGREEIHS